MNKFNLQKKGMIVCMIVIGSLMTLGGFLASGMVEADLHNLQMALGVVAGLGASFLAMGLVSLIRLKTLSPDKLKQLEIDKKDERNVQIMGKVYSISYYSFVCILTLMILTFVLMSEIIPAFICLGALYLQIIIIYIAKRYYNKRM